MTASPFIHLRTHSAYSLLEGAVRIPELTAWCQEQRMPAVAISDSGNMFGALEFAMAASKAGVQPIHAAIIYLEPHAEIGRAGGPAPEPDQLLLIAQDEAGWSNLLALVSQSYLNPPGEITPRLSFAQLEGQTDGLIALTSGIYGTLGKHLLHGRTEQAEATIAELKRLFPHRCYLELMRHGLAEEKRLEPLLLEVAVKHELPVVATNDAYFIDADMYEAHDALLCVAGGTYVAEEKRRKLTPEHRLKTPAEMTELFEDIPEALENTANIARRCNYMSRGKNPILPHFGGEHGEDEAELLAKQAIAGLQKRLAAHVFDDAMDEAAREVVAKPYRDRLNFELDVITKMQFPGYFLIVADFIQWAKEQGIPVGPGRGSGAGSVVAWALTITDLDPLKYGLLFERFLNPERVSMPDFDIDFCQERRDEVIAYVQQKYGRDRVAQIITFGKLQARAVLRDVGRVLQMPYGQVDRICKLVPNNPANPVTLQEAIEQEPAFKEQMREEESVAKLIELSLKLEGLNRHASTHAAGVVIGDRPLQQLVPMYRDPKSDMPVVQYSMKYAEAAGLVKFDFLGLKTLSVLANAAQMVNSKKLPSPFGRGLGEGSSHENQTSEKSTDSLYNLESLKDCTPPALTPALSQREREKGHRREREKIDLSTLPLTDPATFEMLGKGDSVGVFQLESAGMRDTLKKLRPDSLEDIIALVSLYRPGPMDNIPTYIARKHGTEKPNYLHPKLEPILTETFGVIIYQEQVMQIAQVLAGYSLGEADLLRRAMGKKIRAEMEAQRGVFVDKAVKNGVERSEAKGIFDLIAKFAEYGFNKSHAAAYAMIAYQTAYLKANHPVEFIAASMNFDMHNTDKLGVFVEEAGRMGIEILPPDVNVSLIKFCGAQSVSTESENAASDPAQSSAALEQDASQDIVYALAAIRNVGEAAMETVVAERKANGVFKDIVDFVTRVPAQSLNKRGMEYLIKAGAFDALHPNRRQLFDSLESLISYGTLIQEEKNSNQESLFGGPSDAGDALSQPPLMQIDDWPRMEKLSHEFDAIGFYLSGHPLSTYESQLERMRVCPSSELEKCLTSQYTPVKLAGIVTARKFKSSDRGRFAFVNLSDASGLFEVSIFDEDLLDANRERLEAGELLFMEADGKKEEAGTRLIVRVLKPLNDALAGNPHAYAKNVNMTLEQSAAIDALKQRLGDPASKGSLVTLTVELTAGGAAIIALPKRYALSPDMLEEMKKISGIREIVEA